MPYRALTTAAAVLLLAAPAIADQAAQLRLMDVAFDALSTAGTSTATESALRGLDAGGHDPKNRGFTVQNLELTLGGIVDPTFRGDANLVYQIDEAGETVVEVEEAYLTTRGLPHALQVKSGAFFNAFGRLNAVHPHAWDFVDQPVVSSRILGPDGLRGPGAQISWLAPLPFFAELTCGIQNAQGETAVSFRGVPGDAVAGHPIVATDVRGMGDLIGLARAKVSFDLSDETTLVAGLSALDGPNGSGQGRSTRVGGLDLYVKWKPLANDHGWPFLAFQAEAMGREYGAAATSALPDEILRDQGAYAQLLYGVTRGWVAGLRVDYAEGNGNDPTDPLRDARTRISPVLTYYPSEFSKIRFQASYDRAEHLSPREAWSFFVQFEITMGAHGAHKF